MGVGKTLTMIASIASSLREANSFVSKQSPQNLIDTRQKHPTHSTLILMPSACEFRHLFQFTSTVLTKQCCSMDGLQRSKSKFRGFYVDSGLIASSRHVHPGRLCYYKYHGPNRSLSLSSNMTYDIVLSTYGTVAADFRRGGGVLNSFKWYRLVLDEGRL